MTRAPAFADLVRTFASWRLHGWRGGLAAGLLSVIPGASFDRRAALLAALSLLLVLGARWSVLRVLGVAAAGGLLLGLAT